MESWVHNQTAESLEDREQLLRLILENAPVGIITVEPEGSRIHSVNPHFCQLLGYSAEELLAMDIDALVHPDDQHQGDTLADQLLAGSISQYNIEVRFICKNGSVIISDIQVNLVRDPRGEPQLLVGHVQDITARKKAEEERHSREALLRLTFENAPIGMCIVNKGRAIISANPALAAMLGYSRAELESLSIVDITHPDDREATENLARGLWEGSEDSYNIEKRYLRKNGSPVVCQVHVSVVRDEQGVPLWSIGQMEDITERLEAVRETQDIRTYLKNMIDSMPSMLVAVDQEGRVTQWNAAAVQASGISAEQALGRDVRELIPIDDQQSAQIFEAMASGKPVKAERIAVTLKGEARVIDAWPTH